MSLGPQLTSGPQLAQVASKALGVNMEFDDISEYGESHFIPTEFPSILTYLSPSQS